MDLSARRRPISMSFNVATRVVNRRVWPTQANADCSRINEMKKQSVMTLCALHFTDEPCLPAKLFVRVVETITNDPLDFPFDIFLMPKQLTNPI